MKETPRFDLPPALSTLAESHDWLYSFIFWVSVVLFLAITGAVVWFAIRYHHRKHPKAASTPHNMALELTWTFTPLILLAFLFYKGMEGFLFGMVPPEEAIEIHATARQWQWSFRYPGGGESFDELVVPVGRPVKIVLQSADVVHAFYIPAFRVKRDAVPGMYTTVWFEATEEAETTLYCAEYCGAPETRPSGEPSVAASKTSKDNQGHSAMLAKVRVVSDAEYQSFLEGISKGGIPAECEQDPNPEACWGKQLVQKRACLACHNVDGSRSMGPTWKGLWGKERVFTDGTKVVADENYIRESILQPAAKVVKGYPPAMSPFPLPDEEIAAIVAYLKTLK